LKLYQGFAFIAVRELKLRNLILGDDERTESSAAWSEKPHLRTFDANDDRRRGLSDVTRRHLQLPRYRNWLRNQPQHVSYHKRDNQQQRPSKTEHVPRKERADSRQQTYTA